MGKEGRVVEQVVEGIDVYGCMSEYALGFLSSDYGRTDGVVTPGGVRLAEFQPAPKRADAPTLLLSGAYTEPRKGAATVLAALPAIAEQEPDVRLWLLGPGGPAELLGSGAADVAARGEVLGARS